MTTLDDAVLDVIERQRAQAEELRATVRTTRHVEALRTHATPTIRYAVAIQAAQLLDAAADDLQEQYDRQHQDDEQEDTDMDTNPTADQTQRLRYYGPSEVPESPGWTLVTYADGIMIAEDIIDNDQALDLLDAGIEQESAR